MKDFTSDFFENGWLKIVRTLKGSLTDSYGMTAVVGYGRPKLILRGQKSILSTYTSVGGGGGGFKRRIAYV